MIDTIIGALLAVISLAIGYYVGRGDVKSAKETITKTRQMVEDIVHGKPDVGPVMRPDPLDIKRFNDPKFAEEEQVMIEQFDKLMEKRVEQ